MKHIVARPPKITPPPWADKHCGECGHGTWDMNFHNLDVNGKPTLVVCPFETWKRIRSEKACSHYVPKNE